MKAAVRYLGIGFAAVLLAMSMAELHPHPYQYDDGIFFTTIAVFIAIYAASAPNIRRLIFRFALVTGFTFHAIDLWYWIGTWKYGLWFPHAPELVEQFMHIDGESGYNAEVSNLFLLIWLPILILWQLSERAVRRFSQDRSLRSLDAQKQLAPD